MTDLRRTSLFQAHQDAHATLVPFAGWEMPVSYAQGTIKEIQAVRTNAGVFDVSHMGEAHVFDHDALAFVQHVTTNDASKLTPGTAQYSLLLNEAGGIIDDIIVYCYAEDDYVIVLNAGCKDADWAWLQTQAQAFPAATLADESDDTALIAVQGQTAADLVVELADMDAAPIERFTFRHAAIANIPCTLSRTGYTGEDGFEVFCPWDDAPALWHALTAAALRRLAPVQTLVGLRMDERAIPRDGFMVHALDGALVGATTSGTYSPTVKAGIALARLDQAAAPIGTRVEVNIRGRLVKATVVPTPFYRNGV